MTYLTDEEEQTLESLESLVIKRGDRIATLTFKDVYVYSDIDFEHDEEMINAINKMDPLNVKNEDVWIPANYHYNTHSCTSSLNKYQFTLAGSSNDVLKYRHGCIGKPEKVIIFKTKKW